jgi:fatty acid desaturase
MEKNPVNEYFERRPDIVSFILVVTHLTIVIGPLYLGAVWGPGYHLIGAWLLFGLGMNGIINLMHECAHYLVFKSKPGSDFLGKFIIAPLLFTNFEIYRKRHWEHHKHLGVEGETKDAYLIEIKGRHIILLFLRCLFLIEAVKKFTKQLNSIVTDDLYQKDHAWAFRTLLIQIVFFLSLAAAAYSFGFNDWPMAFRNAAIVYVFVYMYGVMTLTIFAADLRAIAEHQPLETDEAHAGYAALRNFKCTPLSRFIMGCYGFGEHYTHHKVPGIPYYSLEKATKDMAKEDQTLAPTRGYFQMIMKIIKSPPHS